MIANVLSNVRVHDRYYKMEMSCPEMTGDIKPGQFLMLKVREGYEPFLRRPFSLYGANFSRGMISFEIVYKVVGTGTQMMTDIKKGEKVEILAPLGNGFTLSEDIREAIIVAGGIGIAPLVFLAELMNGTKKQKPKVVFLYGGQNKADIIDIDRIKKVSSEMRICTEDGSLGSKMLVTELLEECLKGTGSATREGRSVEIFSCGPKAMLKVVSSIAEKNGIPCQVSLESFMACGFGACLGCVVKVREESGNVAYERVCKEGPVFHSKKMVWDE